MDEERARKVEKGLERLAVYKKKKRAKTDNASSSADSSLSLSPVLLPEGRSRQDIELEQLSGASSISEHLSSDKSVENDRSYQEIEISNVPSNVSLILTRDGDAADQSTELRPSLSDSVSDSASKNVRSVLDEILRNDQFRSESERLKSDSTNDASLNIFAGVDLDDSSLNNYVVRAKTTESRSVEELLSAKESVIAALNQEIDSLKEVASSQSTLSLNTTLTEYKQCQEECTNKIVEYKNALSHRDGLIADLTDSLKRSLANEQELRAECEQFANEIRGLQTELAEAAEYIKGHRCGSTETATLDVNLEETCKRLAETLGPAQTVILDELKIKMNEYVQGKIGQSGKETKALQEKLDAEKAASTVEINRLREMLSSVRCGSSEIQELQEELKTKYMTEMEELRTYYEKKCADMEKHYSDEIFSQQSRKMSSSSTVGSDVDFADPGGGGDGPLARTDLLAFKRRLAEFADVLEKYDVERLDDETHARLNRELSTLDFKGLLRVDLADLRSKYNAELEILRQDHENEIDAVRIENEALRAQLDDALRNADAAVQEVANSGEFELVDIVKSYQIRLQEQVALAKIDIMSALEHQIQLLASNPCDDSAWPDEFLRIRNTFTEKYETEIGELREAHEAEIARLKEEHHKALNGALERARRRSLRDGDSSGDFEILKERNNLKKSTSVLRNLVAELLKYFTRCEDELNSTLIEELIKRRLAEPVDLNDTLVSTTTDDGAPKRVHLAPTNIEDFLDDVESKDVSAELRDELGTCLERLRSDANSILALSFNVRTAMDDNNDGDKVKSLEERIGSLTRQIIVDSRIKEEIGAQAEEARRLAESLEEERARLEGQVEELLAKNRVVESELARARDKIGELVECGRKEIVSEGYGENDKLGLQGGLVNRTSLSELQEKARALAAQSSTKADNPLLQLIEELCREGDRLVEDAKRERQDFIQQVGIANAVKKIEAADKKLRTTTHFLEEQAAEREQERDEAQKDIAALKEQLRERDKDRAGYERICKERAADDVDARRHEEIVRTVEQLEAQMREMSKLIDDGERRHAQAENERKEAVDKIWVLRDIIRDLEAQVDARTKGEAELGDVVVKLEEVVRQHREANEELTARLQDGEGEGLRGHIARLEEEIGRLRLTNELAGNEGVLKHIQLQLHEIELTIDKSTHDLESQHGTISATSCSSPSEEMSIRDQIRPQTPNSTADECDIPLQQLARLKEKLIKHSRAEHAALKRIQDLEMQIVNTKHVHDELQNERDVLQDQVSEQLVLISSLQMRLDDQRIRAEHIQKQTNASLEVRIYDLENEVQALRDTLHTKENSIKQLTKTLEQTQKRLRDREQELSSSGDADDFRAQIDRLVEENRMLRSKIESDAQNAQLLPGLVDNILADKNRDIELLRRKLSDTERQLDLQLKLNAPDKKTERRGLLTFVDMSDAMRDAQNNESLELSGKPEISCIEPVGPPNVHYTVDEPLVKANSTEIQRSAEKRVHFQETPEELGELRERSARLEVQIEKLADVEESLKVEQEEVKRLRLELVEVKMHLTEKEKSLELLEADVRRKDDMYFNLAKEKHDSEKVLGDVKEENQKMKAEIEELTSKLTVLQSEKAEALKSYQEKESQLRADLEDKLAEIRDRDDVNRKLEKEVANKTRQLKSIGEEMSQVKELFDLKQLEIEQKNAQLIAKNGELAERHDEVLRLKASLEETRTALVRNGETDRLKMTKQRKDVAERDLEIVKLKTSVNDLKKEIVRLQDFLGEKDKVIGQMRVDSESLRANLEAIKAKMAESGNVLELRERLLHERQLNAQLRADLGGGGDDAVASLDEISEQVRKQLDYSAHLDDTLINAACDTDSEALRERIGELETRNRELEEVVRRLEQTLEKERKACDEIQLEDAHLLEQLRLKLERALEAENQFEAELKKEKLKRSALEEEVATLKKRCETLCSSSSSKTEYKSLPDTDAMLAKNELAKMAEENEQIRKELHEERLTARENVEKLKYTKNVLNLKNREAETLRKQVEELTVQTIELRDKYLDVGEELAARTKEVENSRQLIEELNHDLTVQTTVAQTCRQQSEELQKELELMKTNAETLFVTVRELETDRELRAEAASQRNAGLDSPVPERCLQKIRDLEKMMGEYLRDNAAMTSTLAKLNEERTQLQARVRQLEERNDVRLPFDDPVGRANHLFGKYLRADSYRHALAWQKKYLIKLLVTYQEFKPFSEYALDAFQPKNRRRERSKGARRFRSAVCVVVAVLRMKFMVQRWHSGSRCGAYMSLQRKFRAAQPESAVNFHVGQPVSGQHFSPSGRRFGNYDGPVVAETSPPPELASPWSGFSPPTKETPKKLNIDSIVIPSPSSSRMPDISRVLERFNLLQERLGTSVGAHNS